MKQKEQKQPADERVIITRAQFEGFKLIEKVFEDLRSKMDTFIEAVTFNQDVMARKIDDMALEIEALKAGRDPAISRGEG
jgi:hypothetical protein